MLTKPGGLQSQSRPSKSKSFNTRMLATRQAKKADLNSGHSTGKITASGVEPGLHGDGFGGEAGDVFMGLAAAFGVGVEHVLDGREFCAGSVRQDRFDDFRNCQKWKALVEEGGYGHFVGGIQGTRQGSTFLHGFASEAETGKATRGGFFEIEAAELGPVELDLL